MLKAFFALGHSPAGFRYWRSWHDGTDDTLDQFPLPSRLGATRVAGIGLSKARVRAVLAAAAALSPSPGGFTVADLTARVQAMTGQAGYIARQAAYDIRKLRGKDLVVKPGSTRRYQVPPPAVRAITALLVLRDQVTAPLVAGIRVRRHDHIPATWTPVDRDYEALRTDMYALFGHLGHATAA